jgi:RHS repeat-associated protein
MAKEPKAYYATRMVYAENGRTVNYLSQQQWCWYEGYTCTAGCGECPRPTSHSVVKAEEFRYDQARERYYELQLDAADFKDGNISPYGTSLASWTDFQDGEACSRYNILSNGQVSPLTRYEPGLWRSDSSGGTWPSAYLHNDHLGTLRRKTGSSGVSSASLVFTAFGERIDTGSAERYGYAGEWGYQTAASDTAGDPYVAGFPFQHVGNRYYDPASGRFLQRDPIGIAGGTAVYVYALNSPASAIDPNGLTSFWRRVGRVIAGAVAGAVSGAVTGSGIGAATGAIAGAISGLTSDSLAEAVVTGSLAGFAGGVFTTGARLLVKALAGGLAGGLASAIISRGNGNQILIGFLFGMGWGLVGHGVGMQYPSSTCLGFIFEGVVGADAAGTGRVVRDLPPLFY